jgi:hypothetical protein
MRSLAKIFPLLVVVLLSGCKPAPVVDSHPAPTPSVQDGSSFEQAIVITAQNEDEGVKAEYRWLREHFPGYREIHQYLMTQKGHYDRIDIMTVDGQSRSVYFDINSFFGK